MSDSGGNKDEDLKQKLHGVMEEAGLILTPETVQAMYDMAALEKSTKSTKASSTPSATQEVNSLATTLDGSNSLSINNFACRTLNN